MTGFERWPRAGVALLALSLAACGNPGDRTAAPAAPAPAAAAAIDTGAPSPEQLFQWAQMTYPELFPDAPPLATVTYQGRSYLVRSYINGNHLGVSDGQVYGLGSFTQGQLQGFGSLASWSDTVCPQVGCGAWDAERGQMDRSVTVQPPTVSGLVQMAPRGGTIAPPQISGTLGGNVTSLSGQPLWLVVEDPSQLFEANAQVRLQPGSPWRYTLDLQPRRLPRAGRFTGTLRAFACLDSACATRLGGTPLKLPYDVTVVQGVQAQPAALSFTSTAGIAPDEQTVSLGLDPRVLDGVFLSASGGSLSKDNGSSESVPVTAELAGSTLRVRVQGAAAGTWRGVVTVGAAYRLPDSPASGRSEEFELPVTYTVGAGSALAVPVPSQLNFSIGAGLEDEGYQGVRLQMDFGHVQFLGIEYGTHPAAETDAALLAGWVGHLPSSTFTQFSVRAVTCRMDGATRRCLAPGVYTAWVRHRVYTQEIRDGQLVDTRSEVVAVPVTLTVVAR